MCGNTGVGIAHAQWRMGVPGLVDTVYRGECRTGGRGPGGRTADVAYDVERHMTIPARPRGDAGGQGSRAGPRRAAAAGCGRPSRSPSRCARPWWPWSPGSAWCGRPAAGQPVKHGAAAGSAAANSAIEGSGKVRPAAGHGCPAAALARATGRPAGDLQLHRADPAGQPAALDPGGQGRRGHLLRLQHLQPGPARGGRRRTRPGQRQPGEPAAALPAAAHDRPGGRPGPPPAGRTG